MKSLFMVCKSVSWTYMIYKPSSDHYFLSSSSVQSPEYIRLSDHLSEHSKYWVYSNSQTALGHLQVVLMSNGLHNSESTFFLFMPILSHVSRLYPSSLQRRRNTFKEVYCLGCSTISCSWHQLGVGIEGGWKSRAPKYLSYPWPLLNRYLIAYIFAITTRRFQAKRTAM